MPVLSSRGAKSQPNENCALGVAIRSGKYSVPGLTLPTSQRTARRQRRIRQLGQRAAAPDADRQLVRAGRVQPRRQYDGLPAEHAGVGRQALIIQPDRAVEVDAVGFQDGDLVVGEIAGELTRYHQS